MNHNKAVTFACQEPSTPGLAPPLTGPELFREEGASPSMFFSSHGPGGLGVLAPSDASSVPGPSSSSAPPIPAAAPWPYTLPPDSSGPFLLIPSRKAGKKGLLGPPGGLPGGASFDPEASGPGSGVRGSSDRLPRASYPSGLAPSLKVFPGPPGAASSGAPAPGEFYLDPSIAKVLLAPGTRVQKESRGGRILAQKWEHLAKKREDLSRLKKDQENLAPDNELRRPRQDVQCGAWGVVGVDDDGNKFMKSLDCGREWCPVCRESSHARRASRWIPKLQKIKSMGYWVVSFEPCDRPRTVEGIEKYGWVVTEILKRWSFARGVRRWHPFGDDPGDRFPRWHPHLNFLVDGGFLSKSCIKSIKKEICEELGLGRVVVNYHYTQSVSSMLRWLRYVTRPTFLKREWDPAMAEELSGFTNCASWGQWEEGVLLKTPKLEGLRQVRIKSGYFEDKWALSEKEKELAYYKKIQAGISPVSGQKIKWSKAVRIVDELATDSGWQQVWSNLWQLRPPPEYVQMYRLLKEFAAVRGSPGS